MSERTSKRKILTGVVVSDKMNKTRVVRVQGMKKHGLYQKPIRQAKKYKVHDEKNESKVGDTVRIMETRRLSKDKRWQCSEIIIKARSVS